MKKKCCVGALEDNQLPHVVQFLKIVAEENRLRILCMLLDKEQCVCEIWQFLKIPQNLTSHHLKVLKDSGLIASRKEGLNVFYSINNKEFEKSKKLLDKFLATKEKVC